MVYQKRHVSMDENRKKTDETSREDQHLRGQTQTRAYELYIYIFI